MKLVSRIWAVYVPITFFLVFIVVNKKFSPDYAAYSGMFHGLARVDGQLVLFGQTMMLVKGMLGDNYEAFLLVCVSLGALLSWMALRMLQNSGATSQIDAAIRMFVVPIALGIFVLEFYVVRLRAGFSIFFLFLSTMVILTSNIHGLSVIRVAVALIFAGLSCLYHDQTFYVLCAMIAPPLLLHLIPLRIEASEFFAFTLVAALAWYVVFMLVDGSWVMRGHQLRSPLNEFRLLASCIAPLAMLVLVLASGYRTRKQERFPLFFITNYCCASLVVSLFYFNGLLQFDGEAVVRIMTLSSLGAIISTLGWRLSPITAISVYLVVINGLFFVNTLFLRFNQ